MKTNGNGSSPHEAFDSADSVTPLRVGVLFGGRSSEHEVSLASAANVMDALRHAGYEVAPIGITQEGRWLTAGDPHAFLTTFKETGIYLNGDHDATNGHGNGIAASSTDANHVSIHESKDAWALLPRTAANGASQPAVDVIFPVLHGPFGEDGTVQGLLEMANLPYVGCGVLSSALSMDKEVARRLFAAAGLPQTAWRLVMRQAWHTNPDAEIANIEDALAYPLFVKPANMGSSVGVSKAHNQAELRIAIENAARFDRKVLIEEAVPNAREIELSVLGNENPIASVAGEIVPGAEFYDYAAKYLDDSSDLIIPADLNAETVIELQRMAVAAFKVVEGSGLARVDFLVDGSTGKVYLNEINTMPGFTRISMYPKLWEASGVSYAQLVDRLVKLAFDRFEDRAQNSTARE